MYSEGWQLSLIARASATGAARVAMAPHFLAPFQKTAIFLSLCTYMYTSNSLIYFNILHSVQGWHLTQFLLKLKKKVRYITQSSCLRPQCSKTCPECHAFLRHTVLSPHLTGHPTSKGLAPALTYLCTSTCQALQHVQSLSSGPFHRTMMALFALLSLLEVSYEAA